MAMRALVLYAYTWPWVCKRRSVSLANGKVTGETRTRACEGRGGSRLRNGGDRQCGLARFDR